MRLCSQGGNLLEGFSMFAPKPRDLSKFSLALFSQTAMLALRSFQLDCESHDFGLVCCNLPQSFVSLLLQLVNTILRSLECSG